MHFPAGTRLFDPSRPPRYLYLLKSGRIRLSSARGATLDYLGPGSFFGEKHFLRGPCVEQVAEAVSPVTVIAFRRSDFLAHVRRDHQFGRLLLKDLVSRLDRCEQTVCDLVTEPTDRRLARALLRLAPARRAATWVRLPWNPTNPELARMVGTTRWRVSHFLNHFQRMGWLRRENGTTMVHREGLSDFLKSPRQRSRKME